MRFQPLSLFFVLLIFSGCVPSPDVPLVEKLSHYGKVQQKCSDLLQGKSALSDNVENECAQFLKRLQQSNALGTELISKKLTKPQYAMKEIDYARHSLKLEQQYEELAESLKAATLSAIKRDDAEAFTEGINFPGNRFIAPYYDYMQSQAPRFDEEPHFLAYRRQASEQLVHQAQQYLDQGNEERARALFEEAAEMHNPQAARSTALLYEDSSIEKALHWHLIAVNGKIRSSSLNIARLYEAQEKPEEALKWYLKAAESGDAKAQLRLYRHYRAKESEVALSWLQKSAQNGYPQAQYSYALILMQDKKRDKAIALLQKASQNGYQQASDYLGQYYYDLKRYDRALQELSKSKSADAFYLRAEMAEDGLGMQQDYSSAYRLYSRALALGKKDAGDDAKRLQELQNREQQRLAEEEKKVRAKRMAEMVKECGEIPTATNIKQCDKKIHLTGVASAPAPGSHNVIIYGDDAESYYLINAKGIGENGRIDVAAKAIGRVISLRYSDDKTRDIYQFTYLKPCVQEEEQ
ncbi:MAG: sel1 repeat family protein [Thiovulaceae bacterium]|nr:sel1 repeat family protein [Sulfurimonadaceae bacterium]